MIQSVLETIISAKQQAVEQAQQQRPLPELMRLVRESPQPRDFKAALLGAGLSVIAEIKKASPSRGVMVENLDVCDVARQYEEAGAAAISVVTEEAFFAGHLQDVQAVKQVVGLPVLRKDFIFDAYQVWESRAAGADAILLIASLFDMPVLRTFILLARRLRMATLVEIRTSDDLKKALDAGADLVGVNARDLNHFVVDLRVPLSLAPLIPPGIVKVAESGIKTAEDLRSIRQAKFDAVLIGETLMRAEHPGGKLRELIHESATHSSRQIA
ncbi:MAG: indole-3-glycerol phosphate synthase TrpC [Acidobacteriota bacterium]|nr:indole-3-glycerol phosphate synthase TrpC [Blastocatellia bacterium]MDW8240592.1 indole-3-glycerol phosphate synthase TrpC [Acidobacteriota bacterium]